MAEGNGISKGLFFAVLGLLVVILVLGVYFYLYRFAPMKKTLAINQAKISDLNRNIEDLNRELNAKITEMAKSKQQIEDELKNTQAEKDSLVTTLQKEIDQNQIQITQLADKLKVSIVDKILFPSGQSGLTPEGVEVLRKLGGILKGMKDKIIQIEGHTDNVPIAGRLTEKFPTNWELSASRATNVGRFLQESAGIDPSTLVVSGRGEYMPVASNDTPEGRAQNRRIEIMLLPK